MKGTELFCAFLITNTAIAHPFFRNKLIFFISNRKSIRNCLLLYTYFQQGNKSCSMPRYIALLILTSFIANSMYAQPIKSFNRYLSGSNQVLYVTTANADAIQGTMVLYERKNTSKPWKKKDSFAIVVGRAGLAKAPETVVPFSNTIPVKKEGDGKSP